MSPDYRIAHGFASARLARIEDGVIVDAGPVTAVTHIVPGPNDLPPFEFKVSDVKPFEITWTWQELTLEQVAWFVQTFRLRFKRRKPFSRKVLHAIARREERERRRASHNA